MRYIFTLLCSLSMANGFCQLPFEGKITYNLVSSEKDANGDITIFFGKSGLRIEPMQASQPQKSQDVIIINFDSGKIFTLVPEEKKYKETLLKKRIQTILSETKEIAGFSTTPVMMESLGMPRDFASLFGSSVLYPANNLTYKVPDEFVTNLELLMVNKGRIVLGGDFYLPDYSQRQWNLNDSLSESKERKKLFSVIARQVSIEQVDPGLMLIPAGYVKKNSYDYSVDSMATAQMQDSSSMQVDSMEVFLQKPPAKKKKPAQKKKLSNKQTAIRRKEE